ncbi:hypothetical protein ACTFIU_002477 [Dictyostelium citrinum]
MQKFISKEASRLVNNSNINYLKLLSNKSNNEKSFFSTNILFSNNNYKKNITNININKNENNNGNNNENNNQNNNENSGDKNKYKKFLTYGGITATIVVLSTGAIISEEKPNDNNQIPQLQLPKDPNNKRERIIVLGTGWASLSFIQEIDLNKYEIVVVSPRNYFLFTPMLTEATVGSVEVRSIIEPIRRVLSRLTSRPTTYIEAECTDIDYTNNCIEIETHDGSEAKAKIQYDKLVVAVGSVPQCFGTKGVEEHCIYLKEAMDAHKIRQKIMDCFERASFPGTSEEEKKRLLSFLVVGGGPTSIEGSSALYDYIKEDLSKMFPHLAKYPKITLVQSADHLLNTFDLKISNYTEKQFERIGIEVLTNTRAVEVKKDHLVILRKAHARPPGEPINAPENPKKGPEVSIPTEIPFGMCIWSTGVGPRKITQKLCNSIESQKNNRAITTDSTLKVLGIPNGNVYAAGDCSTISQTLLMNRINEIFKEADTNNDNQLSFEEIQVLFKKHAKEYPQLSPYSKGFAEFFNEYDINKDGFLQLNEFKRLMEKVDSNLTALPSTAQCASQQAKYLAETLNDQYGKDLSTYQPKNFSYKHLGSFAYIGSHTAIADIPQTFTGGGFGVWWMWKAVYLKKQFSLKNKFLVSLDWVKTTLFGRDISRI